METDRIEQLKNVIDECRFLDSLTNILEESYDGLTDNEINEKLININDQCQRIVNSIDSYRREDFFNQTT